MTADLIDEYKRIHADRAYGNTSVKNLPHLLPLVREKNPQTLVDYGCGQSRLAERLTQGLATRVTRYDPAIPELSTKPEGVFDLLLNTDVLEHIEEEALDPIIAEMAALSRDAIIIVDTGPAVTLLSDGRNAHVTIRPTDWWAQKLGRHFPLLVPIRVRSSRRAAFKTWHTPPARRLVNAAIFARAEAAYRWRKLVG